MRKAFTLVEMLVAVVLLSLLIGVAMFSFRLQLISIHKIKTTALDKVIKYTQIKSTIESLKYYVVDEYDIVNQPLKKLHYFFKGDEKSVRFITTNPIYSQGDALVEFSCEDNKLVYKEEPLFQRIDFLRPDFLEDSYSNVLFDDLKECSISYILNTTKTTRVFSKIPKSITLFLNSENSNFYIFSKIFSDDNKTKARVYDAAYPIE